MNKKQKSKIRSKVSSIIKLSLKITEETRHDVFFEYFGHVKHFRVDLHINGWIENQYEYERICDLYIKDEKQGECSKYVFEYIYSRLSETEKTLENILYCK